MNRINYDKSENKVTITGCSNCPFFDDSYERIEIIGDCNRCLLNMDIDFCEEMEYIEYFPDDCPLRDPNFKFTRILE